MMEAAYRNVHNALPSELNDLLSCGDLRYSRNGKTRELLAHTVTLYYPTERVHLQPHRNASIFAQVAETVWLLAGRDDIGWLTHYLPRAPQFSDDGMTWRAAYGPRLRDWPNMQANGDNEGIDQLDKIRLLLLADQGTRQAVLGIWDPARDLGIVSKDIPCNDTIQFLARDGQLNMHVFVRSNDIWWGWSGINTFAWSVLLEAMAYWTGLEVGHLVTFAGSWHLYDRHWESARKLVAANTTRIDSVYQNAKLARVRWGTTFSRMDDELNLFFRAEQESRERANLAVAQEASLLNDPWLYTALRVLNVYNAVRMNRSVGTIRRLIEDLPHCDLALAAEDWVSRVYLTNEHTA